MASEEHTNRSHASKFSREENIRRNSENYGRRFCTENAPQLGIAISTWRNADRAPASDITIRIYNREKNEMTMTTLADVLDCITLDSNGDPPRLVPNQFGQVVLSPNMYVSAIIYHTIVAAWFLNSA